MASNRHSNVYKINIKLKYLIVNVCSRNSKPIDLYNVRRFLKKHRYKKSIRTIIKYLNIGLLRLRIYFNENIVQFTLYHQMVFRKFCIILYNNVSNICVKIIVFNNDSVLMILSYTCFFILYLCKNNKTT